MPRSSTLASVQIGVSERTERLRRVEPDSPFHILVAGDFSAGLGRHRRPILIDRDNFDEVLSRLAPDLRVPAGGKEITLHFREMDDFHPDHIRSLLPEPEVQTAPPAHSAEPGLAKLSGAELLRQMMGEDAEPAPAPAPKSEWDRMIHDLVAPHAAPAPDPGETARISERDAALSVQMRTVLHRPQVQALEAAWRGLYFLTRRLETGEHLKLFLLDMPQSELSTPVGLVDLRRNVVEEGAGGEPWAAVAGIYSFSPGDEPALTQIAAIARSAGTPFLAGLAPDVVGQRRVFSDLRRSADARWVGLALPRFLLRLPYGKATDSTETFQFEEMPSPPEHELYLWGHPALACVCLLGQAFSERGWAMRPGIVNQIDGLPAHVYQKDGQSELKPCAEVWLTEDAAETLLDRGFIPLASVKGTDRVKLVRFQSMAEPAALLSGRWG